MTTLRLASFLGDAARPHYAAVAEAVARRSGLRFGALEAPGLPDLDRYLAEPGPALLFLCGLPYVRARDAGRPVEALAAPVGDGSGPLPRYRSELVGRDASVRLDRRLRMAYNGDDSLSGWVLPRRTFPADLYRTVIRSGSHRASLRLLLDGEADAAAIDSMVLALEARADPRVAALPILRSSAWATSPPVVLLGGTPALADRLRDELAGLGADEDGRRALALGAVERFEPVADAAYGDVRELDLAARG
jgi:phosphonate transport system substrate-binding protein